MEELRIDVDKLRQDADASLVVSFMMASNDIERLVYLRELHQTYQRKYKVGSFESSISMYTMNLLVAHIYEAYYVLRQIKDNPGRPIEAVINGNPELKKSYHEACQYIDDTKDMATNQSPYDTLLRKWKDLRNIVVFHYNPDEDKIPAALKLVANKYGDSAVFIGKGSEPTFHELAHEVIDAIGSDKLGYTYGDDTAAADLVKKLEPMIHAIRKFGHLLIIEFVKKYPA